MEYWALGKVVEMFVVVPLLLAVYHLDDVLHLGLLPYL